MWRSVALTRSALAPLQRAHIQVSHFGSDKGKEEGKEPDHIKDKRLRAKVSAALNGTDKTDEWSAADANSDKDLSGILNRNKKWVKTMNQDNPGFFERQRKGQMPQYLWIGCSDSRVPANELLGLGPGEVFVHRNLANLVVRFEKGGTRPSVSH